MHIVLPRSTSIRDGSFEDLATSAAFQSGNSLKLNMRGSNPHLAHAGRPHGLHTEAAATCISGSGVLTRSVTGHHTNVPYTG